jgi:hypothetical protein
VLKTVFRRQKKSYNSAKHLNSLGRMHMEPAEVKERIKKANEEAAKRLLEAEPYLIDTATAVEVIPGMKEKMLLHAAPFVDWKHMCGPQKGSARMGQDPGRGYQAF